MAAGTRNDPTIAKKIVELVRSKRLFDLKPTDEQCRDCIRLAEQEVMKGGGAQHCEFHGPHIGSKYGNLSPRLVLVGLENPERNYYHGQWDASICTEPELVCREQALEEPKIRFGSPHRNGELTLIKSIFKSAEIPFAHVATLNRRLHGVRGGRGGRKSKSGCLPACPYAAEILRLLRPEVIVIEGRQHGWLPTGKGWGTWIHRPDLKFSAKLGKKRPSTQSADIFTTDLDGNKVALVLANHPSTLGVGRWTSSKGNFNYMDTVLVPAVRKAIDIRQSPMGGVTAAGQADT